jgi:serine protease AprX
MVYAEEFTGGDGKDLYGHGTHVAGVLASTGKESSNPRNTTRFRGVAPDVSLLNLRVLNEHGVGATSAVIAAINRAVELRKKCDVQIINISLGHPIMDSYTNEPLCQAVEAAWKAGIVVEVAAGNLGRDNSIETLSRLVHGGQ